MILSPKPCTTDSFVQRGDFALYVFLFPLERGILLFYPSQQNATENIGVVALMGSPHGSRDRIHIDRAAVGIKPCLGGVIITILIKGPRLSGFISAYLVILCKGLIIQMVKIF